MRDIENILKFWQAHDDEDLVLATIIKKHGSGYRSVGAKKIISREDACGLLSGGCLEDDITQAAQRAWQYLPVIKAFSTMTESESVFGYQTGCAGIIDILFEKIPAGTVNKTLYIPYGSERTEEGVTVGIGEFNLGHRQLVDIPVVDHDDLFYEPWIEPVTLCIIGCGPDAPALVEMANLMGWQTLLLDYRPGYVVTSLAVTICALGDIASNIPEGDRVAVLLMTHNVDADLRILNGLNGKRLGYLGCLGPRKRFEQMQNNLLTEFGTQVSPHLQSVLHAPPGLLSRGRTPEEIALSITAEIQSVLREQPSNQPCPI